MTKDVLSGYISKKAEITELKEKTAGRSRERIAELTEECREIEVWIEGIPDSLTRRIFRMYFMDGMSQRQIGELIHLERSGISKKITCWLKDSHNSHLR